MIARPGRVATLPRFVLTLGLYGLWRRRDSSVLTDRRVLLGRGFVRRSERSIPLSHVDDVRFARSGLNAYADLTVEGGGTRPSSESGPCPPLLRTASPGRSCVVFDDAPPLRRNRIVRLAGVRFHRKGHDHATTCGCCSGDCTLRAGVGTRDTRDTRTSNRHCCVDGGVGGRRRGRGRGRGRLRVAIPGDGGDGRGLIDRSGRCADVVGRTAPHRTRIAASRHRRRRAVLVRWFRHADADRLVRPSHSPSR